MPLYLDGKRLAANDRAAAAAQTSLLSADIAQQYSEATTPEAPSFSLPTLGQLGVSSAPSPIMSAIATMPTIGRRVVEAAEPAISWALPSLESLGVAGPKPGRVAEGQGGTGEYTLDLPPEPEAIAQGASRPGASSTGYAPATSKGAEGVEQWSSLVSEAARQYGVPEAYIKGLMEIESSGNPGARSVQGAMGLMQVMCVDEETEALTERGWLRVGEIEPYDLFLTYSLDRDCLEWQRQEAPIIQYIADEVWHLKNHAVDFVVTPNHKWVFYKPGQKHGRERYLAETSDAINAGPKYILRAAPYAWPEQSSLPDAVVSILGWVVTDGWIPKAGQGVTVVQKKAAMVPKIRALFAEAFPKHLERDHGDGAKRWSVCGDEGRLIRRLIGPDKRLSSDLLSQLTRAQAEMLLEALIDGDGTRRKREQPGGSIFYGADYDRMGDVQMLCMMLGKPFNIRTAIRAGQVKPHHSAFYAGTASDRVGVYVPNIKVEKIKEPTPVWCPSLPNRTWVARRHGKVSITGNSFHFQPGEDPMDPRTNVFKGVKIFADNLKRYGDPDKAAAAYFGAIDDRGNITSATDATGTDGHKYVNLWRNAAAKYGGETWKGPAGPPAARVDPTGNALGTAPNVAPSAGDVRTYPNAGAPPPAASPPSAPAAAAAPTPSRAAGAYQTQADDVTVRMPNSAETMRVPRSMVGEGPGQYAPSKGWVIVEDGRQAQMSALDEARATTGGGETMARQALSQQPELPPGQQPPAMPPDEMRRDLGIGEGRGPIGQGDMRFPVDQPWRRLPPYGATDREGADPLLDRIYDSEDPTSPGPLPPDWNEQQIQRDASEATMYRQPLAQRPEGAGEAPYDPRDADQGVREGGQTAWNGSGDSSTPPNPSSPPNPSNQGQGNGSVPTYPVASAPTGAPASAASDGRDVNPVPTGSAGSNPDIPGPDLGPGGFPIVDQPPTYGPYTSETTAPPPSPYAPGQAESMEPAPNRFEGPTESPRMDAAIRGLTADPSGLNVAAGTAVASQVPIPGTTTYDEGVEARRRAAQRRFDEQVAAQRADRIVEEARAEVDALAEEARGLIAEAPDEATQQAIIDRYTQAIDQRERRAVVEAAEARQAENRRQEEMAESATRAGRSYTGARSAIPFVSQRTADRAWDAAGRTEIPFTGRNLAQVTGLGTNAPPGVAQSDANRYYEGTVRNTLARPVTDIMGEGQLGEEAAPEIAEIKAIQARYGYDPEAYPPAVRERYEAAFRRANTIYDQGGRYASERAPGTEGARMAADVALGAASVPLMPGFGQAATALRTGTAAQRAGMAARLAGGVAIDPTGALLQGAIEGPVLAARGLRAAGPAVGRGVRGLAEAGARTTDIAPDAATIQRAQQRLQSAYMEHAEFVQEMRATHGGGRWDLRMAPAERARLDAIFADIDDASAVIRRADDAARPSTNAERVAAADARMAEQGSTMAGAALGPSPGAARRMFHGTAGAFERPDPAKFDPNGLFGPGYYLTSDPRVAGSYAGERQPNVVGIQRLIEDEQARLSKPWNQAPEMQAEIRQGIARLKEELSGATQSGPNVRAVDVPEGLRLLDVEHPVGTEVLQAIARVAPDTNFGQMVPRWVQSGAADHMTGNQVYENLFRELNTNGRYATPAEAKQAVNVVLRDAGFDGIAHAGGKRIPMMDDAGKPIEHDVTIVFPESLTKIRNAFSGEVGGATLGPSPGPRGAGLGTQIATDVGNSLAGGMAGATYSAATGDEENLPRNVLAGMAGAPLLGRGMRRAGGALGIFGPVGSRAPSEAFESVVRPRVVPPHVADELDFPIRVPDDPATIRAIEAAGGKVDPAKGVDLHVIRQQGTDVGGGTATRGGIFYTAGPPGSASPYAVGADNPNAVGGTQRVEGWTRFRSPLILSDAPGTGQGFNEAMRQLQRIPDPQEVARARMEATRLRQDWGDAVRRGDTPERLDVVKTAYETARQRADDLENSMTNAPTTASIDTAIREARRAGPEGSPARAQALKDLVARYGGDPDLIDPLLAIRGADASESAWAIKENILAAHARKQGYDGVVTVQQAMGGTEYQKALEDAVQAHPQFQAQKAVVDDFGAQLDRLEAEYGNAWDRYGYDAPETQAIRNQQDALAKQARAAERKLDNIHDRLIDEVEVPVPSKITELADVREGANPTPPSPTAELKAAYQRAKDLTRRNMELARDPSTPPEVLAASDAELDEAEAALDALMNRSDTAGGFTLREDVRRREVPAVATTVPGAQNAALPFDPGGAAMGGAAGAMSEDEEGEQGDPLRTGVGMAFAGIAGGLGRGRGRGRPNRQPSVVINGRVVRASSKPPNLLEIAQSYRHSVGMLGQVGTGLLNAMGGPVSAGSALATDVIRDGVMKGYPVPAIMEAGSLVTGLGEAARDMLGTALGFVPQRVRNAPDFRPPLAERMGSPIGKTLGWVIDTPGRLATQMPDAFFGALFDRMGRRRAATELMMESGASRLDIPGQVAEIERLLNNPTPDEAAKIEKSARAFSDEMTYKGPAGYWEEAFGGPFRAKGGPTTANSPVAHQIHDLVGSFLMPFYSSIFKIHKLAATHTPGLGFVADTSKPMSERVARQLVGLGFGLWVADRAAQGLVTGPGPDDPDEKARLKAAGWDEWSTYLPGVGYVKSDNLAQAAPFLKTIGAYYDSQRYPSKKATPGDDLEAGEAVVKQLLRSFEGFPVLRTFSDLYKAAQKPIEGGADIAIGAGASLVPAIVRANEASKDPNQRTVDPNAPLADRIRQRALNRVGSIPGVGNRQDSPPVLDRKGEPVPNPRFGINPFIPSGIVKERKDEDPLIAEMGQYGVDLDKPRDRWAFMRSGADSPDGAPGSIRVMLKPEWQQEWAQARWQALQEAAPSVQTDPGYQKGSDGERRYIWEKAQALAETYADRVVKGKHQAEIEQMIQTAPLAEPPLRRAS